MNGVKKLASDIISQWTEDVMYGWPPDCMGPLYQPERPVMMADVTTEAADETADTAEKNI